MNEDYKQVRPSATLASQRVQCVEMCVHYGIVLTCCACHRMALCKAPLSFPPRPPATRHRNGCYMGSVLPRFNGLGYLVDSNLFSIRAEVNSKLHHASSAIPGY